jgi:ATP-dependent protease ClpP protease subunit
MPQVDQPRREVYGTFSGPINPDAVQRIFNQFAIVSNPTNNIEHVHFLFQSIGGSVGDGVALYNFFRAFTVPLTPYNCGNVASIATIAYLGGARAQGKQVRHVRSTPDPDSIRFATADRSNASTHSRCHGGG